MAARRTFKPNNPDGVADGPIKNTIEIPATVAEVAGIGIDEPQPVTRPVEFIPTVVQPKFEPEKASHADQDLMNAGCEKMLDYLPEDCRELIVEFIKSYEGSVPLWQAIAGYVLRSREAGQMFSPLILPEWQEMVSPRSLRPCDTCGEAMKPITWSQKHCCNACYFAKLDVSGHSDHCALDKEAA